MKYLIFLQEINISLIFVNGVSITNAKVYQGFHNDKKVEEHRFKVICNLLLVLGVVLA